MIWEPFILALVLGIIVSAGLYFAYLWPAVEPAEPEHDAPAPASADASPEASPAGAAAGSDGAASSAP